MGPISVPKNIAWYFEVILPFLSSTDKIHVLWSRMRFIVVQDISTFPITALWR